jgi:hypothetical protein
LTMFGIGYLSSGYRVRTSLEILLLLSQCTIVTFCIPCTSKTHQQLRRSWSTVAWLSADDPQATFALTRQYSPTFAEPCRPLVLVDRDRSQRPRRSGALVTKRGKSTSLYSSESAKLLVKFSRRFLWTLLNLPSVECNLPDVVILLNQAQIC